MPLTRCLGCMEEFDSSQSTVCPHCGYDQNTPKKEAYHLSPGSLLDDRYLIGKSIGAGGFGITYIAWDSVLSKKIAIKEYFPSELATRIVGTTEVCAYDGERTYQYDAGLDGFVNEALRLAKLNNLPNIVHIYDSFRYNCTAYIIMDYVEGETLKEKLMSRGPLPYDEVIRYVVPVLEVLQKVHEEGIIHRDIAPDNIKVNDEGEVTLLDFGAARNATSQNSKSLSIIVKAGYAPEEQYRTRGDQGPWTDVYAMAAVMYHLITGKLPIESIERSVKDELKTPTELGFELPVNVENAIMNALNVKAEYRIQSAQEFADALTGAIEMDRVVVKQKEENVKISKRGKIILSVLAVVTLALVVVIAVRTVDMKVTSQPDINVLGNYEGMDKELALKELDELSINYVIDGTYEHKGVAKDTEEVAIQDPDAGTPIDEIDTLHLKISKAPVEVGKVPSLDGLTKAQAKSALKKAGFTNFKFKTKESNKYKEGIVCDQSIKAGTKKRVDTKITVYQAKNFTTVAQTTKSSSYNRSSGSGSSGSRSSSSSGSRSSGDEYNIPNSSGGGGRNDDFIDLG